MSDTVYPHVLYVENADTQRLFVPAGTTPPDVPPQPISNALATIQLNGQGYAFLPVSAQQLDPYVDPLGEFVQDNYLCINPDLPGFRAYYRPDQNGGREEWVFEYGDPWMTPPSTNMAAYTATITRRDGTVVEVPVTAGHFWYSRWRWQSSPRRVRRSHAQLAAQNLIPFFDTTGLATGNLLTVSDYTPMAYCGIPSDQGQTGGYPGLGIQTGWQTQYLVRGAPESSFRNQGEASGTFQSHVRDTVTGTPINLVDDHPNATMYSSSQGNPYIPRGPNVNRTDQGHMPSVSYLPFLLTGDPYNLEELQFWSNHNMLTQPANSRFMVAGRYLAWPSRAIYEAFLATPDNVPSWLLPKSYWLHWLDVCRGYIEDRMANSSDPWYYVFHSIPDTGPSNDKDPHKSGDHVWQQNMLDLVAAWIATTRDEWVEPAEWLLHSSVDRASEASGWCRARPSPYHMRWQNASVLREAMTTTSEIIKLQYPQFFLSGMMVKIDSEEFVLDCPTPDGLDWTFQLPRTKPASHNVKAAVYGSKCVSWAEAAELNVLTYDWADTGDNNHLSPATTDLTYPSYQRAALAQAIHAGLSVPGLSEAYAWLDGEIRRFVSEKRLPVGDNWCVMANPTRRRVRKHRSDRSDTDQMRDLIEEIRQDGPSAENDDED